MPENTAALAQLAVGVGANVAPDRRSPSEPSSVRSRLPARSSHAAYDAGAHQVEVNYADPYVQLARLEHAPDDALGSVIPWVRCRPLELAELWAH